MLNAGCKHHNMAKDLSQNAKQVKREPTTHENSQTDQFDFRFAEILPDFATAKKCSRNVDQVQYIHMKKYWNVHCQSPQ